jgi:hypothetical protein
MLVSEKRLNDVSGTVTVNLKPGVYVVRLTTGNKIYLSKLLIK